MGDIFVKWLMFAYLCISLAYLHQGDYGRVKYFVGAIILSWGVLDMK